MMEKMTWTRPVAVAEQFMPNEYIAACGDSGTTYSFECDAPSGTLYYYSDLRASSPQPDAWPTTTQTSIFGTTYEVTAAARLGSFYPCPAAHEADAATGFYWGFIDYDGDGFHGSNETVIVWRGESGRQGHATASLDMNSWETLKS